MMAVLIGRRAAGIALVIGLSLLTGSLSAQTRSRSTGAPSYASEFFIISSVDLSKDQLLLKRPTEVTEVMRVNSETRYVDEKGNLIRLTDLRAGDTVYITAKPASGGSLAIEIRKGPMTLSELRRRYLQSKR
jgi:hypothetical protein